MTRTHGRKQAQKILADRDVGTVGAVGTVGRQVVDEPLARGHAVRALTRHPARAALLADVEVVRGDLTEPDNTAQDLEGVAVHPVSAATARASHFMTMR
ncbi:NAD(P)H-binding protein [Streptomyces prasinus]|uniref:NAD(P)H-binding protein n=1 Tax=Streptomyces prasinus TaxID=67345 RepID=UPI00339E2135